MTKNYPFRTAARCLGLLIAVTTLALSLPAVGLTGHSAGPAMVSLPGNVRPEVKVAKDNGEVDGSLQLDHMLLQLQRPAQREAALEAKIEAMY